MQEEMEERKKKDGRVGAGEKEKSWGAVKSLDPFPDTHGSHRNLSLFLTWGFLGFRELLLNSPNLYLSSFEITYDFLNIASLC